MTLYLYMTGESKPRLTLENVLSYTDSAVATAEGVYAPLAEDSELSETADCTGTLRAEWRETHPDQQTRLDELEALVAQLIFGGERE